MTTLTLAARGRVVLPEEVLRHFAIGPGDALEIDLLPGGSAILRASRRTASIASFFGVLADRSARVATIGDIDDAAARGWAGEE